MKQIIQRLWMLMALLCASISASAYDFKVDGICYNKLSDDTVVVTYVSTTNNSYKGNIVIPSTTTYNNVEYAVTSIGSSAFYGCSGLTSIVIPESVTSIGRSAFYRCSALTSIVIPEAITSIGNSAFSECFSLSSLTFNATNCTSCGSSSSPAFPSTITSLTFGSGVTRIPSNFLYYGSQIESVSLPSTLISIGSNAFINSKKLKTIVIPESVTSIGSSAFYGCSALTSIVIPEAVTSIGNSAFSGCSALTSIVIPESVTSIGDGAFSGCPSLSSLTFNATNCTSCGSWSSPAFPSTITSLTFGSGVTEIPSNFLYKGSQIESVSLPSTLISIGSNAFINSKKLKTIVIPESVTSIGDDAFYGCSALIKSAYPSSVSNPFSYGISISYPSSGTIDDFGVIYDSDKTTVYYAPLSLEDTYTIPNTVVTIAESSFSNCTSLTSIVIPETVTSIGCSVFSGCTAIASIVIPESVTSIGSSAFEGCTVLTSIVIPESVTSIGSSAFEGCTALTSIVIPESVTSIGDGAFSGCSSLSSLTFNATNCTICGSSSSPAFPSTITSLTFGSGVTQIPSNFLYNGTQIESVTIPDAVTSIGDYAFFNCQELKSLTLGSGLLSIGKYAFSYKNHNGNKIAKVFWLGNTPPCNQNPISAEYEVCGLVNYVANDQYSLPNQKKYQFLSSKFAVDGTIYVPVSPSERTCDVIDCDYSMQNGEVTISESIVNRGVELTVLNVNDYSFYKNQSIKSLTASNKGNIGSYSFYDCDALTAVSNTNNGDVGNCAFYNCDALSNGYIKNTGSIGDQAFYECRALDNVVLGESITAIGAKAFYSCSTLPSISLPDNVTTIGEYIFYGCSKLATFNIGNGISSIPRYSFANCSVLDNLSIPNNVKTIGEYVFSGCLALANLTIEDNEQEDDVVSGNPASQVFDDWTNGKDSVIDCLQLGSNGSNPLFYDCPLDVVYIGRKLSYNTASSYGYSPFYRNTSLRSVEVADAETQINDNEFYGCTNLKTLKIGNGVKTIGNWAFSGCSSLDYFSAGYMVETIGKEAFSDCTGLKKYYSYSVVPPVCGEQALDDINKWDCTLYVPAESSDEYHSALQWKDFFFIEEMDAVLVAEIRLNEENHEMIVEDSFKLSAEIFPSNATNSDLEWSSSNDSVATVSQDGLVTAIAEGTATITVRSSDGNAEAKCEVNVLPTSGIDSVDSDYKYEQLIYDLNGVLIGNSTDNLAKGLYIVKRGSKTEKIVVK